MSSFLHISIIIIILVCVCLIYAEIIHNNDIFFLSHGLLHFGLQISNRFFFFQFECIIVYFLYCLACLHKKQNVAYATSTFSSFSISIKSHICSVVCIALSVSIQNKKSHIQKKMSMKSLFYKVVGLQVCNFIKNRLQHRCFPVKFAKVLRTPILENICERLLLHIL